MRRIPCACTECTKQLDQAWDREVDDAKNQPRSSAAADCKHSSILEGCNDWFVVNFEPTDADDTDNFQEAQRELLVDVSSRMAELVDENKFGAFSTDDPETDGHCVAQWTSDPHTLQECLTLTDHEIPIILNIGELVCDTRHFNPVPRARNWFDPMFLIF